VGSQQWRAVASVESLAARAEFIRSIRDWFYRNNILEVETPQLSSGATTDPQIESFAVGDRHLRTSVEFHHKRLLASGYPDIYELGKVFRVDESGRHHNPEFSMLEWYRHGMDHQQLIADVEALLQCLHNDSTLGIERISYRHLWQQVAHIDLACTQCKEIVLFLEMATVIADSLPENQYTCIFDYPASQASLARINKSDPDWHVASRFEIYYGSVELANGFHELCNASEQLARFESDNLTRSQNKQSIMPIDKHFIEALDNGLPDCAGVAIGVDRLMMVLMDDINQLQQVLSFDWARA